MTKIDMKKTLAACYSAKETAELVEVPPISFICYEGVGDPNTSQEFQQAMGVLYGLAYTIKFICKAEGHDFSVMPLEGQWWSDNPADFSAQQKGEWRWKLMIAVPSFVDEGLFETARVKFTEKKHTPGAEKASLQTITDGLSAQFLHIGPYSAEGPGIEAMHRRIDALGYRLRGRHREIYMSDPQRTAPEKLRTIVRQPIEK